MDGFRQISSVLKLAGVAGCVCILAILQLAETVATAATQPPGAPDRPGVTTLKKSKAAGQEELPIELSVEQAMWTAIAFEDTAQLAAVLQRGADPNKPEKLTQITALMTVETAALARVLLEAGAEPNLRDLTGRTALHYAVRFREGPQIVRLLAQAGAEVDARVLDMSECTALHLASEYFIEERDHRIISEVIRQLVALGADINATDKEGRSALAIAAAHNQGDLVRLLLELGADAQLRLADGRTALDIARAAQADEAAQALDTGPSPRFTPN